MKLKKILLCLLVLALGVNSFAILAVAYSENNDLNFSPSVMGLEPMTEEELRIKEETSVLTKGVRLNDLALERINEQRKEEGQVELCCDTATFGEETITEDDIVLFSVQNENSDIQLPEKVDNTEDVRTANYFPKPGDQGDANSCGAFSSTYYQMTYMNAFVKGYDVKHDENKILSPRFTYNIGKKSDDPILGIYPTTAYAIAQKHGCPFNKDFAYEKNLGYRRKFKDWPTTEGIWIDALNNKVKESGYGNIECNDNGIAVAYYNDPTLNDIKTYLANGYVLNIVTYRDGWNTATVDGKKLGLCVAEDVGNNKGHAMTVVGYDDTIFYDLNGDGNIEKGERGAFKIINSYGESTENGKEYENWLMYDALNKDSAVGMSVGEMGREEAWKNDNEFYWVTMYGEYNPKLLVKFTITTNNRGKVDLSLGYSKSDSLDIIGEWKSYIFNETKYDKYGGNSLSINGDKDATPAEIVVDYTDLIDEQELDKIDEILKWYLLCNEQISDEQISNAQISDVEIIDVPFDKHYNILESLPNDLGVISGQVQLPLKVSEDKVWNISTNYPLNKNSVKSSTVYVKNKVKNLENLIEDTIFATNVKLTSDKNIEVSPVTKYEEGKYYTLEIDGLKTLAGNGMETTIRKDFFVPVDNIEKDKFSIEDAFTDNNFLNAIRDLVNKPDGYIYWSDVRGIKELNITGENISSLDGIEYFTSLEQLDCSHNNLAELDLSWNVKLKKLNVLYNELTTLDLSHNPLITELQVDDDVIVTY